MDFDNLVSMVPNKRKRNKLYKFINSPRFVVSSEVIGFSVRWGYRAELMASILNISISKYYRVIRASRWVSSSEYLRIKKVLDDKEERSKQMNQKRKQLGKSFFKNDLDKEVGI